MTIFVAPRMQKFVDELRAATAPHPQTLPLDVVRQNMEDQAVHWNRFDVPGVAHTGSVIAGLSVRVYQPAEALPGRAMVYLHGGGLGQLPPGPGTPACRTTARKAGRPAAAAALQRGGRAMRALAAKGSLQATD